jgi:hypothetical protein
MNHGDSVALTSAVFLPLTRAPSHTLSFEPFLPSAPSLLALLMKFAFEIKTEPVTQAAIIVTVVAFSSGSLATVAVYAQSPPICTICSVVLAIIVYLALRFSPR